jgi:hypothetical protein
MVKRRIGLLLGLPLLCVLLRSSSGVGAEPGVRVAAPEAPSPLSVDLLMKEPERHPGSIRVEGVVSITFPSRRQLGVIDLEEFKRCGVVSCADKVLPVRWEGAMPAKEQRVLLSGELKKTGGRWEFVAGKLERLDPEGKPLP